MINGIIEIVYRFLVVWIPTPPTSRVTIVRIARNRFWLSFEIEIDLAEIVSRIVVIAIGIILRTIVAKLMAISLHIGF